MTLHCSTNQYFLFDQAQTAENITQLVQQISAEICYINGIQHSI